MLETPIKSFALGNVDTFLFLIKYSVGLGKSYILTREG